MFNELQKTIWGDWNTRFYIKFMHTLTDLCKTFATKLTLKTNALMQRGKYLLCKSEFNCELSEKNTREKEKENHNFLKMNRLDGECGQRCEFIVCKSLSALYIYIQRCGACIGRCVCVFVSFFSMLFLVAIFSITTIARDRERKCWSKAAATVEPKSTARYSF